MLHGFLDLAVGGLLQQAMWTDSHRPSAAARGNGSANADASAPFNGTSRSYTVKVGIIRHQPILGLQHIVLPSVRDVVPNTGL